MAWIRTVKPEFWNDQKVAALGVGPQLTYIGTWTHSDDYGVVRADPICLRALIFPYNTVKQKEFDGWIKALTDIGRLLSFEESGEKYYFIPTFPEHQYIKKPSKWRNPPPPKDLEGSTPPVPHQYPTSTPPVPPVLVSSIGISKSSSNSIRTEDSGGGDPCPIQKIRDEYHRVCTSLPKVISVAGERLVSLRARWGEHPDLDWWVRYFKQIEKSDFLAGRIPRDWKAGPTFDRIINPNNMTKILEGNYKNEVERKPRQLKVTYICTACKTEREVAGRLDVTEPRWCDKCQTLTRQEEKSMSSIGSVIEGDD